MIKDLVEVAKWVSVVYRVPNHARKNAQSAKMLCSVLTGLSRVSSREMLPLMETIKMKKCRCGIFARMQEKHALLAEKKTDGVKKVDEKTRGKVGINELLRTIDE